NIHIGRALLLTRYGDSIAALAAQLDRLINSDTLVRHISQRAERNRRIGNLSRRGDPSQGHRPLLQPRSQLQIVGISLGQRHFQVERLLPPADRDEQGSDCQWPKRAPYHRFAKEQESYSVAGKHACWRVELPCC